MLIKGRVGSLMKKGLIRSVGVLVGGAAFSQLLILISLPILTRIYSPEDFSVLAVFSSVALIVSGAACLRFEVAVPLPRRESDAINVLALALLSAVFVAFSMLLLLLFLFLIHEAGWVVVPAFSEYLWLLPVGVFFAGIYNAFQFWEARKKNFTLIARTRIYQAVAAISLQSLFGLLGMAPMGLILGQVLSSGVGVGSFFKSFRNNNKKLVSTVNPVKMRLLLRRYDSFPKYSTLDSIANNSGIQMPLIIIASLASGPEAGFLMLTMRAMQGPMSLVGGAVAQVYLSRAPDELRAGRLNVFTLNIITGIFKTGVGPIIFCGLVSPIAFPLFFGDEWARAGELALWIVPWLVFQIISSPISMVMHIKGMQKPMLFLTFFGLLIRCGSVYVADAFYEGYWAEFYALSSAVFYIVCLWTFAWVADIPFLRLSRVVLVCSWYVLPWILCGYVISMLGV